MKKTKTPHELAANASKLHKHIGELLTSSTVLKNYEIRQEYRVSDVNPTYKSNREKFDWVILGLKVIIEIHGEQHYGPVCFGGIDISEAKRFYRKTLERDAAKRQAAQGAGWTYLVVKYTEKSLTGEELEQRIRRTVLNENMDISQQDIQ